MKVFLIVLAVLVVLFVLLLSLNAEFTIIFDNGWSTKVRVLFYEKDIKLTQLLSFLVAPDKAGQEAAEKRKENKQAKAQQAQEAPQPQEKTVEEKPAEATNEQPVADKADEITVSQAPTEEEQPAPPQSKDEKPAKPAKPNYLQKLWQEEGIVGIMSLASNLLQTVNSAISTLMKGLHIYSLYVKMIIGGGDAATIGEKFGAICGWYYPLKGIILNQMKVDQYDDLIIPDFIAPRSEYEFQLIGSLSVGLLLKVGLKAGKVFLVNFLKNRK